MTLRLTQLAILHSQKPEKFLVPDIVCCGVLSGSGRRLSLSLAQYIIHGPHRKQVPASLFIRQHALPLRPAPTHRAR